MHYACWFELYVMTGIVANRLLFLKQWYSRLNQPAYSEMKKTLMLFLGMAMYGHSAVAQSYYYNKTYYSSAGPNVSAVDHISNQSAGESVMLSSEYTSAVPPIGLILTNFADDGTINFERLWNITIGGVSIYPDKLVLTEDKGFIVVGRILRGRTINPFAAKFTASGGHSAAEWAFEYPCSTGDWNAGRNAKVSIAKIKSSTNDYIIVTNGSPEDPGVRGAYSSDAVVTALRINGNTGSIVWSNKYDMPFSIRDAVMSPFPYTGSSKLMAINTMPTALANGDGKSFIAGGVDWAIQMGLGYAAFYMAINDDGSINQGYHFMNTYGAANHHAIVDFQADGSGSPTHKFVLAYTAGSNLAGPSATMAVAMQKFTAAGTVTPDLASGAAVEYQYTDGGDELHSIGLDVSLDNSYYVLSCWSRMSESAGLGPQSMLKLNKAFTAPWLAPNAVEYSKFNVGTRSNYYLMTPLLSLPDHTGRDERYTMMGFVEKGSTTAVRMISADKNLEACGFKHFPITSGVYPATFYAEPYSLKPIIVSPVALAFAEAGVASTSDDCKGAPSPDFYRKGVTAATTASTVNVYPTLLDAGQQSVTLDVQAMSAATLEVRMIGVDGKLLTHQTFQVVQGRQQLQLPVPALAAGQYVINLYTADGQINSHVKVTKM